MQSILSLVESQLPKGVASQLDNPFVAYDVWVAVIRLSQRNETVRKALNTLDKQIDFDNDPAAALGLVRQCLRLTPDELLAFAELYRLNEKV